LQIILAVLIIWAKIVIMQVITYFWRNIVYTVYKGRFTHNSYQKKERNPHKKNQLILMSKSRLKFKIVSKKKKRERMLVIFPTKKKRKEIHEKKATHLLIFAMSKSSLKFKV
jgi:uncharacterized protein YpmB